MIYYLDRRLTLRQCYISFQNHLRTQLQEQAAAHKEQLARVEREKEELEKYKEQEVASFKVRDCAGTWGLMFLLKFGLVD